MFIVYFGILCSLSAVGWLTRKAERGPFGELVEWGMFIVLMVLLVLCVGSLGGDWNGK